MGLMLVDFQATTPVDPRVLDAMLPYLTDQYGNPHSRTHAYGWEAEQAVEDARKVCTTVLSRCKQTHATVKQHVANLIGADTKDIVFTSGATETNNMAIKGVARFHKEKKRHIITTQTVCNFCHPLFSAVTHLYRNTNVYWIHVGNWEKKVSKLPTCLLGKMALSLWTFWKLLSVRIHRSCQS
jgi:cysteine sulfinate desulfinase/cysteine desulfurase-like protein